jgi:hypothetical protein
LNSSKLGYSFFNHETIQNQDENFDPALPPQACLSLSVVFHVFNCSSEHVCHQAFKWDVFGVAWATFTFYWTGIYCAYSCFSVSSPSLTLLFSSRPATLAPCVPFFFILFFFFRHLFQLSNNMWLHLFKIQFSSFFFACSASDRNMDNSSRIADSNL